MLRYEGSYPHAHERRRFDYEGVGSYEVSGPAMGYGDYRSIRGVAPISACGQTPIPPAFLGQIQELLGQAVVTDPSGIQYVKPEYQAQAIQGLDSLELHVATDQGELIVATLGMPSILALPSPWVKEHVTLGYVVMANPATIASGLIAIQMAKSPYVVAATAATNPGLGYVIVDGPAETIAQAKTIRGGTAPPPSPPVAPPPSEPPPPTPGPPALPPKDAGGGLPSWVVPAAVVGGGALLLLVIAERGRYAANRRRHRR